MTTLENPAALRAAARARRTERKGSVLAGWLSSTDHKIIGHMYLITSFVFFLFAGIMALLIRIQLMSPTSNFLSDQIYNELFTMHGTIMLLLFATPLFVGFANELVPLQIGSPDVAFPRLNLLSYYLFAFGGLILLGELPRPRRLRRVRLVRLRAADQRDELPGHRRRPVDHGPGAVRLRHHPRRRQLRHHDLLHARARA